MSVDIFKYVFYTLENFGAIGVCSMRTHFWLLLNKVIYLFILWLGAWLLLELTSVEPRGQNLELTRKIDKREKHFARIKILTYKTAQKGCFFFSKFNLRVDWSLNNQDTIFERS